MKSLLFKSAWSIFRMSNVSFSEALTLAWAQIKEGFKAVIVKSNKLVKSEGLGYETVYFNELIYTKIQIIKTVVNNSCARHDYGIGAYNGD